MTLAFKTSPSRRIAVIGLAALLFAGCSTPTVTPTPVPTLLPTVPPAAPSYTLGPTVSPSPFGCPTSPPPALTGTATVTMTTNFGNIVIKVDASLGPNAAGAFVALASCGYYNNVLFHRIVPGFIIQAGDGQYARLPSFDPAQMGLGGPGWSITDDTVTANYVRGTVAMARNSNANSGGSQFFIVLDDSASSSLTGGNYAIFGNVTSGMDVVDRIASVPLGGETSSNGNDPSTPLVPVVITSTIVTTP